MSVFWVSAIQLYSTSLLFFNYIVPGGLGHSGPSSLCLSAITILSFGERFIQTFPLLLSWIVGCLIFQGWVLCVFFIQILEDEVVYKYFLQICSLWLERWIRGPEFSSQHPHGCSQPSVTLVPENLISSSAFCSHCTHVVHKHICQQNSHIIKEM